MENGYFFSFLLNIVLAGILCLSIHYSHLDNVIQAQSCSERPITIKISDK
jgi:hypothetical protein